MLDDNKENEWKVDNFQPKASQEKAWFLQDKESGIEKGKTNKVFF
jgi:hypothetical protein